MARKQASRPLQYHHFTDVPTSLLTHRTLWNFSNSWASVNESRQNQTSNWSADIKCLYCLCTGSHKDDLAWACQMLSMISMVCQKICHVLHMRENGHSPICICNHMSRSLWYNVCRCLGPFLSQGVTSIGLSLCRILNGMFFVILADVNMERNKHHIEEMVLSYNPGEGVCLYCILHLIIMSQHQNIFFKCVRFLYR